MACDDQDLLEDLRRDCGLGLGEQVKILRHCHLVAGFRMRKHSSSPIMWWTTVRLLVDTLRLVCMANSKICEYSLLVSRSW